MRTTAKRATVATVATVAVAIRSVVTEKVLTRDALIAGVIYTKESIAAIFARNDSNPNVPAGTLKVNETESYPLYKCGEFAGQRTWFVPVCEGYLCLGDTIKIDNYWYDSPSGCSQKTRDAVLRASLARYK